MNAMPRQPGPAASYVLTEYAPSSFQDSFEPNVAIEPSNEPGMMRVYRRCHPRDEWRQQGPMMDWEAAERYCEPLQRDSSG